MPGFAAIGMAVGLSGIGATIGGIAISAAVGAAIGGLTSAVMGGDIGKGMLFGAVGGVVTGGIAGGAIVKGLGVSAMDAGTASIGQSVGGIAQSGFGQGLPSVAMETTKAAGSTIMGGAVDSAKAAGFMGKMFQGSGGELISAAGQAFMKGEKNPQESIEWREDVQQHEKEMAKLRASLAKGGGGGGGGSDVDQMALERLRQKGALDQIGAKGKLSARDIKLQAEEGRESTKKEYALRKDETEHGHKLAWDKQKDTAKAAADVTYQEDPEAYERIAAAEAARGEPGTGRPNTALQGGYNADGSYVPSGNFMPGT